MKPPVLRTWTGYNRTDVIAMLKLALNGSNQKQLAERIGISPSWLCDILNGQRAPAGRVLKYLRLTRVPIYSYQPEDDTNTVGVTSPPKELRKS